MSKLPPFCITMDIPLLLLLVSLHVGRRNYCYCLLYALSGCTGELAPCCQAHLVQPRKKASGHCRAVGHCSAEGHCSETRHCSTMLQLLPMGKIFQSILLINQYSIITAVSAVIQFSTALLQVQLCFGQVAPNFCQLATKVLPACNQVLPACNPSSASLQCKLC